MIRRIGQAIMGLFLLAFGLAVVWGMFLGGRRILGVLLSLEPEVLVAIVSAFTGLLIALVGRHLEKRAAATREQQERRIPVYEKFVTGILGVMQVWIPKDQRKEIDTVVFAKVTGEFTEKVMIWGSPEVLSAWVKFKYQAAIDDQAGVDEGAHLLLRLEDFFLAMRKDLGLSNRGITDGDLLKLFVTDLDQEKLADMRKRLAKS